MRDAASGAQHVEIDAAELSLMLEGIDLAGAKRKKRYRRGPRERTSHEVVEHSPEVS